MLCLEVIDPLRKARDVFPGASLTQKFTSSGNLEK